MFPLFSCYAEREAKDSFRTYVYYDLVDGNTPILPSVRITKVEAINQFLREYPDFAQYRNQIETVSPELSVFWFTEAKWNVRVNRTR